MTCVIFFFSGQYIDSLDLIARAPSAPILSDNGILATGLPCAQEGFGVRRSKKHPMADA